MKWVALGTLIVVSLAVVYGILRGAIALMLWGMGRP